MDEKHRRCRPRALRDLGGICRDYVCCEEQPRHSPICIVYRQLGDDPPHFGDPKKECIVVGDRWLRQLVMDELETAIDSIDELPAKDGQGGLTAES